MTKRMLENGLIGTGLALSVLLCVGPAASVHAESENGRLNKARSLRKGAHERSDRAPAKEIKGYALVEAVDPLAGTIQLLGEVYQVTQKTELQNEYGLTARLNAFEAAERKGPFMNSSTGSAVYFEVGKNGSLMLLRIVKDVPS